MSTVLADKIADDVIEALFTNGSNQKACRLVLELGNGQNGGGWAKFAARDHIIDIIDRHLASREAVEHNMHPTGGGLCAICGKSENHHEDHVFVVLQSATSG